MIPGYYGYGVGYHSGYSIYLILMAVCFVFSLWAQASVNSAFRRYSRVATRRGLTGRQAAECVLRANGVSGIQFARIGGSLTDNFNPTTGVISLSSDVYDSTSVASVGVAAHEAGHAVQHAVGYGPIRLRMAIIPICSFGSRMSWPLLVIGLAVGITPLIGLGVAFFRAVHPVSAGDAAGRAGCLPPCACGTAGRRTADRGRTADGAQDADSRGDDLSCGARDQYRTAAPSAGDFRKQTRRTG